jgi:hypothetical protein
MSTYIITHHNNLTTHLLTDHIYIEGYDKWDTFSVELHFISSIQDVSDFYFYSISYLHLQQSLLASASAAGSYRTHETYMATHMVTLPTK